MKIKLLIATGDRDYAEHLSNVLSEKYADTFEVGVCSSAERLRDLSAKSRLGVVLLESGFISSVNLQSMRLPILLWDTLQEEEDSEKPELKMVQKYQRISAIVADVLEIYADSGIDLSDFGGGRARITAVWSPCGGTGKTTVALAYAASKVSEGKKALYLNLEDFASTSVYFSEKGKSISTAFEKLDSNASILFKGIRMEDSGSGISYFSEPNNYDDINILTPEDIRTIFDACAVEMDELVVDLSSSCNQRTQKIFELADIVLLVSDNSQASQRKQRQFLTQHSIAQKIQDKSIFVANRGAKIKESGIERVIELPKVPSADAVSIYKTLSGVRFDW